MFATNWLKVLALLLPPCSKAHPQRPVRRVRPQLEVLEDRYLLAAGITEFSGLTSSSLPNGIALGPDGNLWFTEYQNGQIGEMSPSGLLLAQFSQGLPSNSEPSRITAGSDGNLWF